MPEIPAATDEINDVFRLLWRESRTRAIAQQRAAGQTSWRNTVVGTAATLLAAVGGTSAFISLAQSTDPFWVQVAAVFSVAAAVVTGLQTWFNYGERTAKHSSYAAKYGDLAGRIRWALATPGDRELTEKRWDLFHQTLTDLDAERPRVSDRLYARATAEVSKEAYQP